jgi:uncharacterized protein
VFDNAKLLTDKESELVQSVKNVSEQLQIQLLILTTDNTNGQSTERYVENFNYGIDDTSYIVFCIDMDNRQLYISTFGEAMNQLTDSEVDEILDDCVPYATEGNYSGACEKFLSTVGSYVIEPSYVQKLFSVGNILRSLIIGLVVAAIVVFIMYSNRSSRVTANSSTYKKGKARISGRRDIFVHQTVTQHRIEREDRSPEHRSHGGGGRGF